MNGNVSEGIPKTQEQCRIKVRPHWSGLISECHVCIVVDFFAVIKGFEVEKEVINILNVFIPD